MNKAIKPSSVEDTHTPHTFKDLGNHTSHMTRPAHPPSPSATAVIGLLENPLQKQKGNAPNVYCMPSWLQWCGNNMEWRELLTEGLPQQRTIALCAKRLALCAELDSGSFQRHWRVFGGAYLL